MVDKPSEQRIAQLHPMISSDVRRIVCHINNNVLTGRAKVRVSQGVRTWAEQTELYAQGRTKPGKKVTNAKAGQSIHNFALAFDIVLIIDGKEASWDTQKDWDGDKQSDWMEVVTEFKKEGFSWGGDWRSFKDMPHFEKTFGKTLAQLQNLHTNKQWIPGTVYVKL